MLLKRYLNKESLNLSCLGLWLVERFVMQNCCGYAVMRSVIGLKNSRHLIATDACIFPALFAGNL